jgi:hypothetical protein
VLELINLSGRSGRVVVTARVPLVLLARDGKFTAGAILDWQGLDAVRCYSLHSHEGQFRFEADVTGPSLWSMPFDAFLTEWARVNDEWSRVLTTLDSPSRVVRALPGAGPPYSSFLEGRSVRAVARAEERPLIEVAARAYQGLRAGQLELVDRYAWYAMRLQRPGAAPRRAGRGRGLEDVGAFLDGSRNMGDLVEEGFEPDVLRRYLADVLRRGEVNVPGRGWLLRDLSWELDGPDPA